MPIYLGNKEILNEYVDSYQLGNIYLGNNKIQSGGETFLSAVGGTISYYGDYRIHTFTNVLNPSLFQITKLGNTTTNNTIDYLIVGGGGAGGYNTNGQGPGGGAGGFLTGSLLITALTSSIVTVGAGGLGTNAYNTPTAGNSSSLFDYIAYGGGCYNSNPNGGSGAGQGGLGTAGQGFNGGTLYRPGGGGAGQAGQDGTNSPPLYSGNGGNGSISSITGTSLYYAGGGGGGGIEGDFASALPGTGGLGGGGNGGDPSGTSAARSGKNGSFYGAGGGGMGDGRADVATIFTGNGYQGIVIVRYLYK